MKHHLPLHLRPLLLAPLALVLLGCEFGGTTDPVDRELQRLQRSRELWERQGVRSYRYTVLNTCECPPERVGPVVVEVEGGQTVSARYASSGEPAQAVPFHSMDTVGELFDTISRALDQEPDQVRVEYDVKLGYPRSAYFDYDRQAVDEEGGFTVTAFERR